ncbi:MAG: hypothetical protein Q8J69_11365 [Sphingobacteriaceae bacterium]|nr:hypothetical protein [Sphingobacteriaceae bacterium]
MAEQDLPKKQVELVDEESLVGMPKFIKSWRQAYGLLLAWLVLLVVLLYWFSEVWG